MPEHTNVCLQVSNLAKKFVQDGPFVLDDVSFSVTEGESFGILGPSGCGKTTLLRIIAGFEQPSRGSISINGRVVRDKATRIPPEQRGVGFVFQDYALFPHLSVRENVRFGVRSKNGRDRESRVNHVLQILDLMDLADRTPHDLSGGQQQRVAIARSLAPSPKILLMDEPFSNLDAMLRQEARKEVRNVLRNEGVTSVLVTHDQEEALSFADRVAVVWNGRIEQIGPPEEIYARPSTLFVAQFLGRTNLILSEVKGTTARTPIGDLAVDRSFEGPALLSLRPEHLSLVEPDAVSPQFAGVVVDREFRGHDITFTIDISGASYLVHTDNLTTYDLGDAVGIRALSPAIILEKNTIRPTPS